MKKLSENNQMKVVSEAIKVAIGAAALAALLYYIDIQTRFLATLNIDRNDITMIGLSAAGFCLLWVTLHHWFFTPYLKLYEKREKLTVGAADDFKEKENEIAEMLEKYEILTLNARSQAMKERAELVGRAKTEANAEIEKAKGRAQESMAKAKKELSERKVHLQNDAQKEAEALATQMVSKVLESKTALN